MLQRRIVELANTVRAWGGFRCTHFLNDRQLELAGAALNPLAFESWFSDGGYPNAERRILCLYDEWRPTAHGAFQSLFIEISGAGEALTHRDYLGALLSLGLRRECIGDILPHENGAYVFTLSEITPFVIENLVSVSRYGARIRPARVDELPHAAHREEKTISVASLRLDVVLAAMLHISRSEAVELIRGGLVEINHISVSRPSCEVFENDRFSIRGYGKYTLSGIGAQSRKGRTFITFLEF